MSSHVDGDLTLTLPPEVLWTIAQHLGPADLRALSATSRLFQALVHDDCLWHAVYARVWSRPRPPLPTQGVQSVAWGPWRWAVERRERTLRWVALMAAEGQQEPPSLLADARRRFDYFAELLAILADHSKAGDQVRRLGEQLVYGISRSTVAPTIESRHPRAVVRLAFYALAELIIHDLSLGIIVEMELAVGSGQALHLRNFGSDFAMSMATAYLHAGLGLCRVQRYSHDVKVKGMSVKLPAALLPVEKFDDREDPQQQPLEPAAPSGEGSEVVPPAPEVLGLCQALTGSWRGYYFFSNMNTENEMLLTLAVTDRGELTGKGHDRHGAFTLQGTFRFDTGLATFTKHYPTYNLPYRGRITSNGLAGTWGARSWGGTFLIWRNGEDTEESRRAEETSNVVARPPDA